MIFLFIRNNASDKKHIFFKIKKKNINKENDFLLKIFPLIKTIKIF